MPTTPTLLTMVIAAFYWSCGNGDAGRELQLATQDRSLPVLGKVPDFTLTGANGSSFGSAQLDSSVWIANFIFTRCPATCPMQSTRMSELQERLKTTELWSEINLVSFTVDPGHDTPQVLGEYGRRYGAETDKWQFLTGTRDEMWNLSKVGFKLAVGENPPEEEAQPLFHSQRLVLVDRRRQVRGYYDGVSAEGLQQIERDIGRVLENK